MCALIKLWRPGGKLVTDMQQCIDRQPPKTLFLLLRPVRYSPQAVTSAGSPHAGLVQRKHLLEGLTSHGAVDLSQVSFDGSVGVFRSRPFDGSRFR